MARAVRIRKRFDPEDIARFREQSRNGRECPPEFTRGRRRVPEVPAQEIIDFKALLVKLRAARRSARHSDRNVASLIHVVVSLIPREPRATTTKVLSAKGR